MRQVFQMVLVWVSAITVSNADNTYKAAVIQYGPIHKSTAKETIEKNVDEYLHYIKEAKGNGVDLIVFPEYGLTSIKMKFSPNISTVVPDEEEKVIPCAVPGTYSDALTKISCAASTNKIYVVINLLEKHETNEKTFYNTNVVLDRSGMVIAKYRKVNLYLYDSATAGTKEVVFHTDFGVRFGLITCFDIINYFPAYTIVDKVNHIIHTSTWFSQTPYLMAVSIQAGYARANGITLLSAGYSRPKHRNGGGGIYMSSGKAIAFLPTTSTSSMITADIAKSAKRVTSRYSRVGGRFGKINENATLFRTRGENISHYVSENVGGIIGQKQENTLCLQDHCCHFEITTKQNSYNVPYKVVLRVGKGKLHHHKSMIHSCGLIACQTDNMLTCGHRIEAANGVVFSHINITATFPKLQDAFFLPSTLRTNNYPLENYLYVYKEIDMIVKTFVNIVTETERDSIVSFGIYGRSQLADTGSKYNVDDLFILIVTLPFLLTN